MYIIIVFQRYQLRLDVRLCFVMYDFAPRKLLKLIAMNTFKLYTDPIYMHCVHICACVHGNEMYMFTVSLQILT